MTNSEGDAVDFEGGENESVIVDLSAVDEDAGYEIIPRAKYPVTIAAAEYAHSQRSGKPMWTLQLEIEGGEYAGRILFHHVSFSEKALPRTKKTISRIIPELLEGPFEPEEIADDGKLLGIRCIAVVTITRYEGQNRNNVKELLEAGDGDEFVG